MTVGPFLPFLNSVITQARGIHDILREHGAFPSYPDSMPVFCPKNLRKPFTLVDAFSEITKKKVYLHRSHTKMSYEAHMTTWSDRIDIVYSRSHNFCEARFYISKELSHQLIYMDESMKGDYTTKNFQDVILLIDNLLNPSIEIDNQTKMDDRTRVDIVAYVGAIELLIPSTWVSKIIEVKNRVIEEGKIEYDEANLRIAELLRVPERIVEFRLGEQGQSLFRVLEDCLEHN